MKNNNMRPFGFQLSELYRHNGPFTEDEAAVIALHCRGDRKETIRTLKMLRRMLQPGEEFLIGITDSALKKLEGLGDEAYAALDVHPEWLTGEEDLNGTAES